MQSEIYLCGRNSNSSEILRLPLLAANMNDLIQNFFLCKSKHSRVVNSAVCDVIWPEFKYISDIMVAIVTHYGEYPIKNVGARVLTSASPL